MRINIRVLGFFSFGFVGIAVDAAGRELASELVVYKAFMRDPP